jgi:hypothetical protein
MWFRALSKCQYWIAPLVFIFCARAFATIVVVIVTPEIIVSGTDRLVQEVNPSEETRTLTKSKSALLRGRYAIACIGLENFAPGPQEPVVYEFQDWVKGIEAQISNNASVSTVADIVERESTKTFTEVIQVEALMRSGAIKRSDALNRFLVQFVVSGFDNGIAVLIESSYELDWEHNRLIGPKRINHLPSDGNTIVMFSDGMDTAIRDKITNGDSYANKRMRVLAPVPFQKLLSGL